MTTDGILTDEQIAALTPEQRRELITRLEQPLSDLIDPEQLGRMRRIRLSLMIGGSIAMIPWLVYLYVTLPDNYVAHNWTVTWVGFDILLVVFMLGDGRPRVSAPPAADACGVHFRGVADLRRVVRPDDRRAQGPLAVGESRRC